MATLTKVNFSGGELTPSLYSRVDTSRYATSVRTARNAYVMRHGGLTSRAGTIFVGEVKDSSKRVKLIPFVFNNDQTYCLEFGENYIRFHKDGAQITEAADTISAITKANPGVITAGTHGFSNGDEIILSGIGGMEELEGRNVLAANVTATTFEITDLNGTNIDTSSYTTFTSGGSASKIYEVTTTYAEADLQEIQYVQSADVMTLVHPSYPPQDLSRTADNSWTLSEVSFSPTAGRPNGGSGSGTGGSLNLRYRVTAVVDETFEEGLPGRAATTAITGATAANPVVISSTAHGALDGDEVYIEGIVGMTELNGRKFTVANKTANTFELSGEDGSGHTAYSSGGTVAMTHIPVYSVTAATTNDVTITWEAVSNAVEYNVYKQDTNGVYGFFGIANGVSFVDDGLLNPDTSDTHPIERDLFSSADNYPSAVGLYQQRKCFANTNSDVEKVWMSQTGSFGNFTSRLPVQNDDAVIFNIAGRQVNAVKHLVDVGKFIIFTQAGEWNTKGNDAGTIVPGEVNPEQHSYNGTGSLSPIVIGGTAIYVQARGTIVRDLAYDFQIDGYRGNDLTTFSSHLFDNYTLTDWSYQKIPHSIVWAIRSDGGFLGLTYIQEHNILGWTRHDFADGLAENVISIPEGSEDTSYFVVKRTIDGRVVRYIERFSTRTLNDLKDFKGMDCSLSYDGRNTDTSHTMTVSTGTDYTVGETLTLTSSTSYFDSLEVGNVIQLTGADGSYVEFEIAGYTSGTVVTGKCDRDVPSSLQATAVSGWVRATDTFANLWHLEGEDVSVFADSFVVGSPNNPDADTYTVSGGSITLDRSYGVVHVGLPFISDVETLDITVSDAETLADKKKNINQVHMFVESSRGIFVGASAPTGTDAVEGLQEYQLRENEDYDSPVGLKTEVISQLIRPEWNSNGRVFIRQVDPVPMTVLSIHPGGEINTRGKRGR